VSLSPYYQKDTVIFTCSRNSFIFIDWVEGTFSNSVWRKILSLEEIATGFEEYKVNFLWVIRKSESELLEGFEKSERGIVERD
jgi:hypothetical protein